PDHHAALHGRVVGELGAADDVQVPAREILGTGRDFRYECFCLFFRHEAALSVDRLRMTRTAQSIYCSDSKPLSSEFRHEDTKKNATEAQRHRAERASSWLSFFSVSLWLCGFLTTASAHLGRSTTCTFQLRSSRSGKSDLKCAPRLSSRRRAARAMSRATVTRLNDRYAAIS